MGEAAGPLMARAQGAGGLAGADLGDDAAGLGCGPAFDGSLIFEGRVRSPESVGEYGPELPAAGASGPGAYSQAVRNCARQSAIFLAPNRRLRL